ncbi:MAG: helix-turn-helix domain-containing protein [Actinomycetota bacterium]|nr:helix-turn-helix domain-containing protein [Actinomycetota bacterium]
MRQHEEPTDGQPLLDVEGAAAYLGVSQPFVRRLVLERRVRYYKVGKFVRFRSADLDAFVNAGRTEPRKVELAGSRLRQRSRLAQ